MKRKIMIFCDYYLPGFKSGGGMWMVANLVDRFCGRYEFRIVTRNHDGSNDRQSYDNVKTGEWNQVGNAKVFYLSRNQISIRYFRDLIRQERPDLIFLNSVFSTPAIVVLVARRLRLIPRMPIILAPCGELSAASIALKPIKKKLYLMTAKLLGLYRGLLWKASFEDEQNEIIGVFGKYSNICVAPDLAPTAMLPEFSAADKPPKLPGSVKFIYLSRIARKKNLHFILQLLRRFKDGNIELKILGPIENSQYWVFCERIIHELPANVSVIVSGPVLNKEGLKEMVDSHFFVLPTLNENFGYVFIEAMAAGCPLLISDRTPWKDLESKGIGRSLPLEKPELWETAIEDALKMDNDEYVLMSEASRNFAVSWLANSEIEKATEAVLLKALESDDRTGV